MLSIGHISFIFNGSKWEVAFNRNKVGVAGIAVPNLTVVSNNKEFKLMQQGYANAILGGPGASLLMVVVSGLIILLRFAGIGGINANLTFIAASFMIINLFMLLTCLIKKDGVFGDFPAYSTYKKDDFFAALMMYQYAMLAVDYEKVRNENTYLRQMLIEGLKPRMQSKQVDILTVAAATTFISEYLVGVADRVPEEVIEYIDYYYMNYPNIINTQQSEVNKLMLLYVAYFFENEGMGDRAIDIYDNFIQNLPKSDVFNYWKIQSEQIILKQDHTQYLLDKKNINPNLAHSVFKKLDGAYHDELILNERS